MAITNGIDGQGAEPGLMSVARAKATPASIIARALAKWELPRLKLTAGKTTPTVDDLANIDLAYAPPYNSAMDPLHNASNVIRNKQSGYARTLTPMEVKNKLENGDNFVLLDVRSPGEWNKCHIETKQAKLLPLTELRKRLGELSRDKEIVILCRTSVRAYQAQRILDGAGFRDVKFMDGSIVAWPYNI